MKKAVAFMIIAALAVAIVLIIILRSGGTSSPTGDVPRAGPDGVVTTASGLKYIDEVVGRGETPRPGQAVTVHYTGTLENGTKFDSSVDKGQPYTFKISTGVVIPGWDEGILTMNVGGKRRLIVPPRLGYGAQGRPPAIPPNSTLIFEVELLGVK